MIKHHFKIALRNLWKNRQSSIINAVGLSMGIALFLLIMEFVIFEKTANRDNKNFEKLYRLNVLYKSGKADSYVPPGWGPVIKQKLPAIEEYVRVAGGIASGVITYNPPVSRAPKIFRESDIAYVDGGFLDFFSYPIIAGTSSLDEPGTLALSETFSEKLFGSSDPIGKSVTVSNQFGNSVYSVKAVYRIPGNSDIKSQMILSFSTLANSINRDGNDWADPDGIQSGFVNIFVQLNAGVNAAQVSKSISGIFHNMMPETKDDQVVLQSFRDLHLAPYFGYPFQTYGSLSTVILFSIVALLILFIAWVNYINLSSAQAINRAREVGVRKVLGARRFQLVFQYLAETLILTGVSSSLAVLLIQLFQPVFNAFLEKPLSPGILNSPGFLLAGIATILAGSLLAGTYVAFVMSGFKPISALSAKIKAPIRGLSLRKGLVVFQFTIAIVLIISTVVLYKQLRFMQNENLGMNLEQLLVIQGPTVSSERQAERNILFKNSLAQLSYIKKYAASNNIPGRGYNFSTGEITKLNNPLKGDEKKSYSMFICDNNFFDTYGISFAQGKAFSQYDVERSWNNIKKVIVNEAAAAQLGFDTNKNIIGEKINWNEPYEIVGIVKDYHHLSLHEPIKPTIYLGSVSFSYFTIKTDTKDLASKISQIKEIYARAFPGNPFEYFFADEQFTNQYFSDQKLGKMFIAAASLSIFISCLGLFGLVAFSARQRVKEIGVRKVLGADIADIMVLLAKEFVILVLIALIVASPISWWAMQKWLQDFAYRTDISWWIFIAAGLISLFIALVTVSFQAVKAAVANPVKSLRTD